MSTPLTPRQQQIFDFISQCIATGCPPTIREIGTALGIRNPNGVFCHLKALADKGAILWERDGRARGIRLPADEQIHVQAEGARVLVTVNGKVLSLDRDTAQKLHNELTATLQQPS